MKRCALFFTLIICLLPVSISSAANQVVVIPLNSAVGKNVDGKVWGEGRVGIGLTYMTDGTGGVCQTPSGIKFAFSDHLSDWNYAASVCPSNTWVCRESDIAGQLCNTTAFWIPHPAVTYLIDCAGVSHTALDKTYVDAWLADGGTGSTIQGKYKVSDSMFVEEQKICNRIFVWCCWK